MDSIDGIPEDAPPIRLCHIKKRDDFNGYGFNLHAEKSKPGQFIGTVDEGSPAERGGLREGDRIVEVNDCNICHENHKQVVARIKAIPDETRMLVVDKETEDYYRNKEIVIRRDLPTVVFISSDDDEDDYHQPPPNNNNYNTRESNDDRRSKKKLENVCHQSFAVEDEEDGADNINYAMQQSSPNPPPLPNSGPPISDEDEDERIRQGSNDRNSLGGSSYDKGNKKLDTDMDSLPPPPNEEELVGEEEETPGNKIVVTATIESSSESGDDPQNEEGTKSHRSSVQSIQARKEIGSSMNQENDKDSLNEEPTGTLYAVEKDVHPDSHSSSSESIVDQIQEHFEQVLSHGNDENDNARDNDDTHSTKSISSDEIHDTVGNEVLDANLVEAAEWNNKMANMSNSVESKSISNASIKNGNDDIIDENEAAKDSVEMRITRDTIVSKENVKIEVTRERKKTLPNSDEYVDDESISVNPPMPAPRTVTPISEKSSTASMEGSSPRSFSPTSFEQSVSLPPNTNNNDVVDANNRSHSKRTNWDGLNLNMTAAEMRERIGSKKKRDPRKEDRMDFRTKYDMIQAL